MFTVTPNAMGARYDLPLQLFGRNAEQHCAGRTSQASRAGELTFGLIPTLTPAPAKA
jgi:hypothetical protein